mgnify:FL=1
MTGVHPKAVQSVMRHSTIILTMDTYGHLFPGQEADAVARLRCFLGKPFAEALRATGTDDSFPGSPAAHMQRSVQQSGCESVRSDTTVCNGLADSREQDVATKTLRIVK